jgi:hypothetical protein
VSSPSARAFVVRDLDVLVRLDVCLAAFAGCFSPSSPGWAGSAAPAAVPPVSDAAAAAEVAAACWAGSPAADVAAGCVRADRVLVGAFSARGVSAGSPAGAGAGS